MAKEENLTPFEGERAKELGQKGGKASGRSRRKRKTIKKYMELILSLPVADGSETEKLAALGIDAAKANNAMLLAAGLFHNAKTGNATALKELINLLGEEEKDTGAEQAEVSKLYGALEREE